MALPTHSAGRRRPPGRPDTATVEKGTHVESSSLHRVILALSTRSSYECSIPS
jgi:hypothetical protein